MIIGCLIMCKKNSIKLKQVYKFIIICKKVTKTRCFMLAWTLGVLKKSTLVQNPLLNVNLQSNAVQTFFSAKNQKKIHSNIKN